MCNDVSARKWQTQLCGGQWCFGKGFDTFNPLGPMIVSSKLIKDPNNLKLGTKVNGQVLQDYNTSDMSEYIVVSCDSSSSGSSSGTNVHKRSFVVFDVATLVSFLSQGTTLQPGEVIITGTPHGVGVSRNPQVWLQHNDVCEIYIEGIGSLVNPVVFEKKNKL